MRAGICFSRGLRTLNQVKNSKQKAKKEESKNVRLKICSFFFKKGMSEMSFKGGRFDDKPR